MQDNSVMANPGPLGLMGFGMTTVLLNLHNAGFFPLASVVMAMGICYGGLAQVIAGILEFRRGNTFPGTAFTSYGFFWLSLVLIWFLPAWGWAESSSHAYMGWYLFLWGLFTLGMFFGTLKGSTMLKIVFGTLTILFFLLALRDWTGSSLIGTIAGFEGIFCGLCAMYLSIAEVLHTQFGRVVLKY